MDYLTAEEMYKKWNVSRRRISTYCKDCRIEGAVMKGKIWLIPENAQKPTDPRKKVHAQKMSLSKTV